MIIYEHGFLGLGTLSRIHGSAAYQVILPALVSTCVLIAYHQYRLEYYDADYIDRGSTNVVQNPYAIGALIAFFSFLLTFRLNYSYMRYWEGATAIHNMLSKWLDCGSTMAGFHYQAKQYNSIEPPTFAQLAKQFPTTNGIVPLNEYYFIGRDRDYRGPQTYEDAVRQIEFQKQRRIQEELDEQKLGQDLEKRFTFGKDDLKTAPAAVAAATTSSIQDNSVSVASQQETSVQVPTETNATDTSKTRHKQSSIGLIKRTNTTMSTHSEKSTISASVGAAAAGGGVGHGAAAGVEKKSRHHRITTMEIADFQQLEATATCKRISNYTKSASSGSTMGNKKVMRTVSSLHSIRSADDDFFQDNGNSIDDVDAGPIPIPRRFQSFHEPTNHNSHSDYGHYDDIDKMVCFESESMSSFHQEQSFADDDGSRNHLVPETNITVESQHQQQKQKLHQHSMVRKNSSHDKDEHSVDKRRIHARQIVPSLFLQEAAHLLSLLSAVAMCTLRNDLECATLPLVEYRAGYVSQSDNDDDNDKARTRQPSTFRLVTSYLLGTTRSSKQRTLYNAAHPLGVLGGVSDDEVRFLERARGPYAKVAVVTMWFEEFISREYMNGSMGTVAPPIVTRLYAMVSDGAVAYNQARKIAYVPFPFPNAQIASFFSMAIIFIFPLLYDEYVNKYWFAAVLNFVTVLCFLGLHEVARELENPFINVPNDLPLVSYQNDFNDALLTMYAGFHPDSYWELKPIVQQNKVKTDMAVVASDDVNNNNNNNNRETQMNDKKDETNNSDQPEQQIQHDPEEDIPSAVQTCESSQQQDGQDENIPSANNNNNNRETQTNDKNDETNNSDQPQQQTQHNPEDDIPSAVQTCESSQQQDGQDENIPSVCESQQPHQHHSPDEIILPAVQASESQDQNSQEEDIPSSVQTFEA